MKTNLKKLMLDRDIDSLSELERQMKVKKNKYIKNMFR